MMTKDFVRFGANPDESTFYADQRDGAVTMIDVYLRGARQMRMYTDLPIPKTLLALASRLSNVWGVAPRLRQDADSAHLLAGEYEYVVTRIPVDPTPLSEGTAERYGREGRDVRYNWATFSPDIEDGIILASWAQPPYDDGVSYIREATVSRNKNRAVVVQEVGYHGADDDAAEWTEEDEREWN